MSPQGNGQPLTLPSMGQAVNGGTANPEPLAIKHEPVIKQEPGLQNGGMAPGLSAYPSAPGGGGNTAASRAAQHLQAYGQRAAASIQSLHSGANHGPHHNQMQSQPQQMQAQPQQGQRPTSAQQAANAYRAQMVAHQQQQQQQRLQPTGGLNGANGLPNSQVDGVTDASDGAPAQLGTDGHQAELGRGEIDKLLHKQLAAMAKRMEGGGLMLPLRQATMHKSAAIETNKNGVMSQVDGEGDSNVKMEDEDAINSDLDDPEEEQDEGEEDDESMGPIMLCMYDKVQRVKNKWCVVETAELSSAIFTDKRTGSAPSRTVCLPSTARSTSSTRPRASTSGKLLCRCHKFEAAGTELWKLSPGSDIDILMAQHYFHWLCPTAVAPT